MKFGIEVLLSQTKLLKQLKGKRVGLVCHPASVNQSLDHSLDLLSRKLNLSCAFGPQHGARGDKQDNMIETDDEIDSALNIPVFSLYGKMRRPTQQMMSHFDVLIYDLQDIGGRIYTFITTLLYLMEECAKNKKPLWILDRPNPAGRPIEGMRLVPGYESFVGAAPIPMRHGLTVGEMAHYYLSHFNLDLDLKVVPMQGYNPDRSPSNGWPTDRAWVNPSPNSATLNMPRSFPGTVLLEGTTLSEGRGTTRPLELIGAPDLDFKRIIKIMLSQAPQWLKGVGVREIYFEPTFHKHQGKLCHGFQLHTDFPGYNHHAFKPYRMIALALKTIRKLEPDYPIFRDFHYEYVKDKLAFDVINGGTGLREWIENQDATPKDLEKLLQKDELSWKKERRKFLLY